MNDFRNVLHKVGGYLLDSPLSRHHLTVLTYHRVNDPNAPDFRYAQYNVSATPEQFSQQMEYVAEHYNVIGLQTLVDHVCNHQPLPDRALLITFDDGYKDNFTEAYPILKRHHFPAVIFLATGFLNTSAVPWWDQCAYYFRHTSKKHATLPLIGEQSLETPLAMEAAHETFIYAIKAVPEDQKQAALAQLPAALDLEAVAHDEQLFLNWDEVRELVANGIDCQAHTVTHPILSRTDAKDVQYQLSAARADIEQQTGKAVTAFAYPNGTPADYTASTLQLLRETGYQVAFTLVPGPSSSGEAIRNPLELRRNHIRYYDSFEMFTLKLLGVHRLKSTVSEIRQRL